MNLFKKSIMNCFIWSKIILHLQTPLSFTYRMMGRAPGDVSPRTPPTSILAAFLLQCFNFLGYIIFFFEGILFNHIQRFPVAPLSTEILFFCVLLVVSSRNLLSFRNVRKPFFNQRDEFFYRYVREGLVALF